MNDLILPYRKLFSGTTITEFFEMANLGCNSECSYDKNCLSYVDISEIQKLKEHFWGKKTDHAQLPKERRESILDIFRTCHASQVFKFKHLLINVVAIIKLCKS